MVSSKQYGTGTMKLQAQSQLHLRAALGYESYKNYYSPETILRRGLYGNISLHLESMIYLRLRQQ